MYDTVFSMPRLINLALIYYLPPLVNCFLILGKSPKLFGSATVNDILDPVLGRESTSLKNLTLNRLSKYLRMLSIHFVLNSVRFMCCENANLGQK